MFGIGCFVPRNDASDSLSVNWTVVQRQFQSKGGMCVFQKGSFIGRTMPSRSLWLARTWESPAVWNCNKTGCFGTPCLAMTALRRFCDSS